MKLKAPIFLFWTLYSETDKQEFLGWELGREDDKGQLRRYNPKGQQFVL